ncbi:hypothetical protein D3C78_1153490 [compost metagenome]
MTSSSIGARSDAALLTCVSDQPRASASSVNGMGGGRSDKAAKNSRISISSQPAICRSRNIFTHFCAINSSTDISLCGALPDTCESQLSTRYSRTRAFPCERAKTAENSTSVIFLRLVSRKLQVSSFVNGSSARRFVWLFPITLSIL